MSIILLFVIVVFVQAKPLEEHKTELQSDDAEIMEVAEGQNPFLPRFAMKKLKERRDKAKAQRRNNQNQRRINQPKMPCPQNYNRRYYVSILH